MTRHAKDETTIDTARTPFTTSKTKSNVIDHLQLPQQSQRSDNLLSRPRGSGIRRHVHVENLPAGVIDHEEHVQRSERDRSDAEEVARPDLRAVLPQEWPPVGGWPATMGSLHILGDRSG
jgi:hypothetical protein